VETASVPGNFAFNPYSDFLKHDMGTLGNAGDTLAVTRQMRTAPLWGLRSGPAQPNAIRAFTLKGEETNRGTM
jgi:CxxC motif-containing protein (DUF1111 family)